MQSALNMVDDQENKETAGARLTRYFTQKSLKPFIYKNKEVDHFKPINCYKGEQLIKGYEATVLADICDAFLEARKHIKLSPRQEIIAEQGDGLVYNLVHAIREDNDLYNYTRAQNEELAKWFNKEVEESYITKEK